MNPDYKHTAGSTVWTITDGSTNIVFESVGRDTVNIITNDSKKNYSIKMARSIWKDFMRRGYREVNECKKHNMENFHDAYRSLEKVKDYAPMLKNIHDMEWRHVLSWRRFRCNFCNIPFQ